MSSIESIRNGSIRKIAQPIKHVAQQGQTLLSQALPNRALLNHKFEPALGLDPQREFKMSRVAPFPFPVVLHFSYHKCLTVYYNRVISTLAREFGFPYFEHFYISNSALRSELRQSQHPRIFTLSMSEDVCFEGFPDYRGSCFIRDPRDLVVSGYRYHLWTKEPWCREPFQGWEWVTRHPVFEQYIESNRRKHPTTASYQEYLQTLTSEQGLLLEMIWRQSDFSQMRNWNYNNPKVLVQRYDKVIGQEQAAFKALFEHYQLHPALQARGLQLVEKYALKNQARGQSSHIRSGSTRQWPAEFSPLNQKVFKQLYGQLLIQLQYESSLDW